MPFSPPNSFFSFGPGSVGLPKIPFLICYDSPRFCMPHLSRRLDYFPVLAWPLSCLFFQLRMSFPLLDLIALLRNAFALVFSIGFFGPFPLPLVLPHCFCLWCGQSYRSPRFLGLVVPLHFSLSLCPFFNPLFFFFVHLVWQPVRFLSLGQFVLWLLLNNPRAILFFSF